MTFTGFVIFASTITLGAALEDRFNGNSFKLTLALLALIFVFKLAKGFLVFI